MVEIGSAFLMTEFSASFLNPQIQNYKEIILKRSKIYNRYLYLLSQINKKFFTFQITLCINIIIMLLF